MTRTMRALSVALALLALSALPVSAQTSPLAGRLADLVREAGLGDGVGVSVVDVASGREIYESRGATVRNPASNMKLVTAAAALLELGPDFQMLTGVYGRVENGRVTDLVVRGQGDPTLQTSDLVELAEGLADRGVRAVDRIWVDASYFDDELLPPAFDQQPDEAASFRAAVGGFVAEQSSFVLRVMPGATVGSAAIVRLAGEGYFQVDNEMTTTEAGAPRVIASQRNAGDGRMVLTLRGTVPAGILGVGYRRRVENPVLHAGYMMGDALERVGIGGRHAVSVGAGPSGMPMLTSRYSPPLAEILPRVGKWSDNFVAEMLLKVLGAEQARPGTSARGAEVLQAVLARAGVPVGAATIVNGSGLFDGNLIAPSHLTKLLRYMYQQPGVRAEYVAQLAVGGSDGTLSRRLRDLPAPRIVRAKTGTLNDAIALSGYVLGPTPQDVRAFSVICNGIRGRQGAARSLADAIVTAIAQDLWPEPS